MREILFRGKIIELCEHQGQWLEGFYGVENGKTFIAISKENGLNGFYCDPETVGQFTGLCDKNGKKIFEDDIIQYELHDIRNRAVIKYGAPKEDSACYGWYLDDNNGNTAFLVCKKWIKNYDCQVIGNIHDNPELIGGR